MSKSDAPGFRSVPKLNCLDCVHSVFVGWTEETAEDLNLSAHECKKYDFRIPYPASGMVCDAHKEERDE